MGRGEERQVLGGSKLGSKRGRGDSGGFGPWVDEGGRRIDGWNRW